MKRTSILLMFGLAFTLFISGCGGGGGGSDPGSTANLSPTGNPSVSNSGSGVDSSSGSPTNTTPTGDPGAANSGSGSSSGSGSTTNPPPSDSGTGGAVTNSAPIANAGLDQTVSRGETVFLDGTGSADPDGDLLTFQWTIASKPGGSAATISGADQPDPSFTADQEGNYVIQLIVVDSKGLASSPSTVTVSTINSAPVADAGPDQSVTSIGTTVYLGGQSYDPDGDSITYSWRIKSRPANSSANLSDPASSNPTFVVDVYGEYTIELVVRDASGAASSPDTMKVSSGNLKPVANAGNSLAAAVGSPVSLDGSGSSDANGDPLTYKWGFAYKPAGSTAQLTVPTSVNPSFIPDLPGTYVVELVVNDGTENSDPSTATITVFSSLNGPIQDLLDAIQAINDLPASAFKNRNMKRQLVNKINGAIRYIDNKLYHLALSELEKDILKKMDGCQLKGAPQNNDWITTCEAQNKVYPLISKAIADLRSL